MFQCNEHVEMNNFLCSLACTWMAIIESQFYIIDMFHWNEILNWRLPGCTYSQPQHADTGTNEIRLECDHVETVRVMQLFGYYYHTHILEG